jgi:hypothetical protein
MRKLGSVVLGYITHPVMQAHAGLMCVCLLLVDVEEKKYVDCSARSS